MAQLVFEFWSSDLDPVLTSVQKAVTTGSPRFVMLSDTQEFRPTDDSIGMIADKLRSGEIVSFSIRPPNGNVRYGLVNAPFFAGWPLDSWFGTIEYLDENYEPLWTVLLSDSRLKVACVGLEEGPGGLASPLTDEMLSVETFPWDDRYLIVGAVRGENGWTIRKGRQYYAPTGCSGSISSFLR